MTDTKTIEVNGCYSCPMAFRGSDGVWICGHPDTTPAGQLRLPLNKFGVLDTIPHDNCPLKTESITIKLKQK